MANFTLHKVTFGGISQLFQIGNTYWYAQSTVVETGSIFLPRLDFFFFFD